MESKKYQKGFTLVELLIVLVILGILASLVIAKFGGASKDSKEASLKGNLSVMRRQLELYKIKSPDGATYPTTLESMVPTFWERIPYEPFSNLNTVVTVFDGSGGWVYESTTGNVFANIASGG